MTRHNDAGLIDTDYHLNPDTSLTDAIADANVLHCELGFESRKEANGEQEMEMEMAKEKVKEKVLAYVRSNAASIYHSVGTCAMGRGTCKLTKSDSQSRSQCDDDDASVVDAELKVHGIEGLRVADASVMPCIPSGNTNAATYFVAERAAQLVCTASF